MIKRIFSAALSIALIITSAHISFAEIEMETVFSKDFSQIEEGYDITADGWKASHGVSYTSDGIKLSGNDANLTYTKSLGAKFEIKLNRYYYEWNMGQLWINADANMSNGYHINLKGQYSKELKITLSEYKNGVKRVLSDEVWDGANTSGMFYHIDISYDRGDFYLKLTNASKTENVYELRYDLTEGGTTTDFVKSGAFKVYGGNGGMLRIKSADIKAAKSDLEATYLGAPFNATAMYEKEGSTAEISVNKEPSELTQIRGYVDGEEQAGMSYKDGEFKTNVIYNEGKYIFMLPSDLSAGMHTVKVVFKDELECEKEYEGKFYVGAYTVLLDRYSVGDNAVDSLAEAAGSTLEAELTYNNITAITAVACLYNADGILEKITSASGTDGKINILCDIPEDTAGYKLSIQIVESLSKPVPLSFAFELE